VANVTPSGPTTGTVRVLGLPRGPLTALSVPGQRADLALAQRDERHLGGGEEAADQYHGKDEENIPADAIHVRILDPRQFGLRQKRCRPRVPAADRSSAAR
jgi:hypothetical protein